MKTTTTYKPTTSPIEKVTIELDAEEAYMLKFLMVNFLGGGELRKFTDVLYDHLIDVKMSMADEKYKKFMKSVVDDSVKFMQPQI